MGRLFRNMTFFSDQAEAAKDQEASVETPEPAHFFYAAAKSGKATSDEEEDDAEQQGGDQEGFTSEGEAEDDEEYEEDLEPTDEDLDDLIDNLRSTWGEPGFNQHGGRRNLDPWHDIFWDPEVPDDQIEDSYAFDFDPRVYYSLEDLNPHHHGRSRRSIDDYWHKTLAPSRHLAAHNVRYRIKVCTSRPSIFSWV